MDGNLSRLYYMIGNYDPNRRSNLDQPRGNSEADNLIGDPLAMATNGLSVSSPICTGSNVENQSNSTAILEVTSNTIIVNTMNNPQVGVICNNVPLSNCNSRAKTSDVKKSNTFEIDCGPDIQVEYHFNPLYTISDGGADNCLQSTFQRTPEAASNVDQSTQRTFVPPSDPYGLFYLALLMAGVGFLLPYNSFVIAADYFEHRFPSTTIVFDMSTTYIFVAFFTVIINNFIVDSIPLFWRLNLGYLLCLAIMTFTIFYEILGKSGGYVGNLVLIGIAAVGCTIQQSSFYGYTSMLPKKYTQAVMTGESAAGILVSLNRIITKVVYPTDQQFNTFIFFTISLAVISVCAFIHIVVLPRSDFIRYHIFLCNQLKNMSNDSVRIMYQINENLGLVNMYHNKTNGRSTNSNNITMNDRMLLQQNDPLISYNNSVRPSIFSSGSNQCLDLIDLNSNVANNHSNSKVENMLRTDSTEFVLPFGIDDEEIEVEQNRQRMNSFPDLVNPSSVIHPDSGDGNDFPSGEFKTKNVTSKFVQFLTWFENLTHSFHNIGIFIQQINRYNKSFRRLVFYFGKKYQTRKRIVLCIWPQIVSIMMIYFVTLTIFPGIESEIYSCQFTSWMPIILMATFNLSDFIGKLMSTFFYQITNFQLLLISSLRFLLIPLIALCVMPQLNPFFENSLWPIIFSIILGLSNGIIGSLPMIIAPAKVNDNMREITGNLMTFSYVIGLTTGSIASYFLNDLVVGTQKIPPELFYQNCLQHSANTNNTALTLFSFYYF